MATAIDRFFSAVAKSLHLETTFDTTLGLIWVLTAAIIAILAGQLVQQITKRRFDARKDAAPPPVGPLPPNQPPPLRLRHRFMLRCLPLVTPLLNFIFGMLGVVALHKLGYDPALLLALKPLFMAWIFITAVFVITDSAIKTTFVALLVVPLSLPFMMPYLKEFEEILTELSFNVGKISITAYMIIKLFITGLLLLWTAGAVKDGLNASLARMTHIRWSTRQLLQNLSSIGVYVVAVLIALSILGIDLTAFAVLGGALGVGIGLGLQKIASNFISGLILLSEQSIQVNDMIEIAGSNISGLVRHTGARYTLIETLDKREIMIPNDDLVTERVVNWTYSNAHGVMNIDVGVAYDSDLEKVRDILLDIVGNHPAVLKDPAPSCLLKEFGASAVNFAIFVHLEDVRERRLGIKSEILFDIWRRFKENNIDIPYPQLKLHYTPQQTPAALAEGGDKGIVS